ncbi:MAG: hypothetical protein QOD96_132 [Pseudonocardiales bacterium]|nr:hypothetical protein [Pseudonocardiales bacterium]
MDYTAALFEQNRLLGELTHRADQSVRVPTCPEWTLQQLVRHVGRGDRWAATIVAERSETVIDPRSVANGKPPEDADGALAWLHGSAGAVVDAVAQVGADTKVWTFIGPKPAEWWIRRRLHESTVHRADAAIALGTDYELSPELAADGVSEWLDLVSARPRSDAPPVLEDGLTLHLHATDGDLGPDGEWMIRSSGGSVSWEHGHGKGTAAVRGRASDLLLAVLRRSSAGGAVETIGDAAVWANWLARTPF